MSRLVFPMLIIAGGMAWSQDTGLRGPSSGVLFDAPSHAIRIVTGIPGAAYLGPALISGVGHAFVAPDGNAALVEQEGAWHLVTDLRGENPVWTPAPGMESVPRLAVWTPDSGAAVFLDEQAGQVRILKTSDASFSSIEAGRLEGRIVALAVNPDARTIYAATAREDGSGAVYRSSEDSDWTLMTATKSPAVLALSAKGEVLYAGDRESGELFEFRQPAGEGGFTPNVYSLTDPGSPITALRVSRDGRKLLVARGGDAPEIGVLDLSTHEFESHVELDSPASALERLPGGPHLLLNSRSQAGDLIMILTDGPADFRAFFVPVGE